MSSLDTEPRQTPSITETLTPIAVTLLLVFVIYHTIIKPIAKIFIN